MLGSVQVMAQTGYPAVYCEIPKLFDWGNTNFPKLKHGLALTYFNYELIFEVISQKIPINPYLDDPSMVWL